eukprot:Protomagalhaensia_wolfi_Nauph_80__3053@NODE_3128_length_883_cov_12_110190_g2452_i0_p1_GENE_NODE_3128_length_883_cov_12_110190_g2452_i0NODE_3128_length_883_cov_12_110190_g2452_i0_p1_ORF_typecomplete_len234_score25_67Invas_SpaK/PF03519_14/7e03Invas_SpaK/PF03519_14/0_31_NODE_3128_length_883_cov_12_110190_g2452_i070771
MPSQKLRLESAEAIKWKEHFGRVENHDPRRKVLEAVDKTLNFKSFKDIRTECQHLLVYFWQLFRDFPGSKEQRGAATKRKDLFGTDLLEDLRESLRNELLSALFDAACLLHALYEANGFPASLICEGFKRKFSKTKASSLILGALPNCHHVRELAHYNIYRFEGDLRKRYKSLLAKFSRDYESRVCLTILQQASILAGTADSGTYLWSVLKEINRLRSRGPWNLLKPLFHATN